MRTLIVCALIAGGCSSSEPDKETDKKTEQETKVQADQAKKVVDKKAKAQGVAPSSERIVDGAGKMDQYAETMCACRDVPCVKATHEAMMSWVKAHFAGGKKKRTKSEKARWTAAQHKFNNCYLKTMKAEGHTPK